MHHSTLEGGVLWALSTENPLHLNPIHKLCPVSLATEQVSAELVRPSTWFAERPATTRVVQRLYVRADLLYQRFAQSDRIILAHW
jgi:hypothetical protein